MKYRLLSLSCALALAMLAAACSQRVAQRDDAKTDVDEVDAPAEPVAIAPEPERRVRQEVMMTDAQPAAGGEGRALGIAAPAAPALAPPYYTEPANRENYADFDDNPVRRAAEHPVSTFSIDVDTGSYANVRRMLNAGQLPPADAVRAEELINYFDYGYPVPGDRRQPFSITVEMAPAPWNDQRHLMLVGLKGYEVPKSQIPAANIVYLVDTSGSMHSPDKIELLKRSFQMMTRQLRPQDRIAIVAYAGSAGLVLPSTPGSDQATILSALDRLAAGGSTNGGAGIELAYAVAQQHFIEGGVNRVILASDGDFNVGTVDVEALKTLVARKRESGVGLTVLGFGTGNLNDHLAEQLANNGNGNYFYVDTLNEGRKVLVEQLASTVLTIAQDVKIQIEFNPGVVQEYRLIGYENRMLNREDFNNDRVDAGEIGAGHNVTALYEVALVGSGGGASDPLRYGEEGRATAPSTASTDEVAFLRLRYKTPGERESRLIEQPLSRADIAASASDRLRFAAAVAGFADALRGGTHLGEFGLDRLAALATQARGQDAYGYRAEFVQLIGLAQALSGKAMAISR